jgi:hypothetical protein
LRILFGRFSVEPLQIDPMSKQVSYSEEIVPRTDYGHVVQVRALKVIVSIPFSGDERLFRYHPSRFMLDTPEAEIRENELRLGFRATNDRPDDLKNEIERQMGYIHQNLKEIEKEVSGYNGSLPEYVGKVVETRRNQLLSNRKFVESLGYPIRERVDSPRTFSPPEVRRKISPPAPPKPKGQFQPEPVLEEEHYSHILGVVRSMTHVLERNPRTFHRLSEEALRDHFLVQLNGHYEGQATGETFNASGQTDILIRVKDRNIFIAECLIWRGPAYLTEKIDQILNYLSWRDTKAAIIIFNKSKNFAKLLESINPTVQAHPNHKRTLGTEGNSTFKFRFVQSEDPSREMSLTVLAFNVPEPKE